MNVQEFLDAIHSTDADPLTEVVAEYNTDGGEMGAIVLLDVTEVFYNANNDQLVLSLGDD